MQLPTHLAARAAALAALLAAAPLGCSDDATPVVGGVVRAAAVPADEVVARVNGAPILRRDLALQLRGGADRRAALDQLIAHELLAQEARRRGLDRDPEVRSRWRKALANRLLELTFAAYTVDKIPRALVEKAYQRNLKFYMRPRQVEVAHILAQVQTKGCGANTTVLDELQRDEARRLGEKALARVTRRERELKRSLTVEEFKAIGAAMRRSAIKAKTKTKVKVEQLTTARHRDTAEPFAAAAFALSDPGDTSVLVETRFGFHVIYLVRIIPGKHQPLHTVEADIRRRIHDDARRIAFEQLVARLKKAAGVKADIAALERAFLQPQARR